MILRIILILEALFSGPASATDTVSPLITRLPGYTLSAAACKEIANTNNGGFERVAVREITDVGSAVSFLTEYGIFSDPNFDRVVQTILTQQAKKPQYLTTFGTRDRTLKAFRDIAHAIQKDPHSLTIEALRLYRRAVLETSKIEAFRQSQSVEEHHAVKSAQSILRVTKVDHLITAITESRDSKVTRTIHSFLGLQFFSKVLSYTMDAEKNLAFGSEYKAPVDLHRTYFLLYSFIQGKGLSDVAPFALLSVVSSFFAAIHGLRTAQHMPDSDLTKAIVWVAIGVASIIPYYRFAYGPLWAKKEDPSSLMDDSLWEFLGLKAKGINQLQLNAARVAVRAEPKVQPSIAEVANSGSLRDLSPGEITYLGDVERLELHELRDGLQLLELARKTKMQKWDASALNVLDAKLIGAAGTIDLRNSMQEFILEYNAQSTTAQLFLKMEQGLTSLHRAVHSLKGLPFEMSDGPQDPRKRAVAELLNARLHNSLKTMEEFGRFAETIRQGRSLYMDAAKKTDDLLMGKNLNSDTSLSEWQAIATQFRDQLERVLK